MTKTFVSMADNFPAVLHSIWFPQNFNEEWKEVQEIHKGFTETSHVAIVNCVHVQSINTFFLNFEPLSCQIFNIQWAYITSSSSYTTAEFWVIARTTLALKKKVFPIFFSFEGQKVVWLSDVKEARGCFDNMRKYASFYNT